jgi:hypothetical protein
MCLSQLAKNLTLEEIDLLWADDDFKKTHADLHILHQAISGSNERVAIDSREKGLIKSKRVVQWHDCATNEDNEWLNCHLIRIYAMSLITIILCFK